MRGVSVIIPTYNRAELLRLTLRSVLDQTVAPLEIIVVDDGSTDQTPEVCAGFGSAIRYIRQTNQRLPAARNAGIRAARGEWIALCDSDDVWRQRKLEIQLAALNATHAKWSVSDFGIIDPDGVPQHGLNSFQRVFAVFQETHVTPHMHFSHWLKEHTIVIDSRSVPVFAGDAFGMLFCGNVALPSTAIIARDLIARAGMFDTTFRAEETEFFHRISAYGDVAIVMEPLTDYRVGHASLIHGDPTGFIQDALRSISLATALRPALTEKEVQALRAGRRRLRLRLAYARLTSLDSRGARRAVYEAWREDPHVSARSTAIMMASLLPKPALRGLHWAKRVVTNRAHS